MAIWPPDRLLFMQGPSAHDENEVLALQSSKDPRTFLAMACSFKSFSHHFEHDRLRANYVMWTMVHMIDNEVWYICMRFD